MPRDDCILQTDAFLGRNGLLHHRGMKKIFLKLALIVIAAACNSPAPLLKPQTKTIGELGVNEGESI